MKVKDEMVKGIGQKNYHTIIFNLIIGGRSNANVIGVD